jgi:hypothetical protein
MALWTDLITPAELTGYARASLEDYEVRKGSLARWLPNRQVLDIVARLVVGQRGLVDEARFRAYDAEPEIGRRLFGKRVSVELPAIGKNLPISEYQQLRTRNASDADLRNQILRDTRDAVQSVADRIERLRGTVLVTGRATIDQANFKSDDDFARSPSHTVTAGTLWSTASADALGYLATLIDLYVSDNGEQPGAILTSQRVVRAMGALNQMQTALVGGGVRPATVTDVQNTVTANGLPALHIYDRKTSGGRVIPDDRIILLPEPSDPNGTSELGATFWGQTLTSIDPAFSLQPSEQPGVVVGVYRNEKPPMIAEVISDAIALPILANADLSLVAKVL